MFVYGCRCVYACDLLVECCGRCASSRRQSTFLEQVGARRGLFLSSSLTQKRKRREEYEKRLQEMQENTKMDLSFWSIKTESHTVWTMQ